MTVAGPAIPESIDALEHALAGQNYVAERELVVPIYLALRLQRPLFIEGEAGVGKTEIAKVLAAVLRTPLIRLQCYEGLDISHAVYEWNYSRQLLELKLMEATHVAREIFSDAFLIKRPLLGPWSRPAAGRPCSSSTRSIAPTRSSKATCWNCCRTFRSRYRNSARFARPNRPLSS